MPNCFQLYKKGSESPSILQDVDAEICAHLGVPVDEHLWCNGWYDFIGFALAMGDDFNKIREYVLHNDESAKLPYWQRMLKIIDFLEANYNTNAWFQRR